MLRKAALVMVVTLGVALVSTPAASASAAGDESRELRDAVTVDGLMRHARALQRIADTTGGTRASGLPGYDRSAAYVTDVLTASGLRVTRQEFPFTFYRQLSEPVVAQVAPSPRAYDALTMDVSAGGDVIGDVVPTRDVQIPAGSTPNSSTSGCQPEDFDQAAPDRPQIALIQRGGCDYLTKVTNAQEAEYDAVVVFNEGQPGRQDAVGGTLVDPSRVPVTIVSFAVGADLYAAAQAGPTTARVAAFTEVRDATTVNVIADTPSGDPTHILTVGAHLDSVATGPGVNDDGSGVAALLEIAVQMSKLHIAPRQKVRFAFWGAEEPGSIGSQYYVDNLPPAQLAAITAYLNFDMVGSRNYVRFLYDGDGSETGEPGPAGSGAVESAFRSYFQWARLPVTATAFEFRSDYSAFFDAGVPTGGVHSGWEGLKTAEQARIYGGTAGAAYDQCYHQACDDLGNIDTTVLHQLSDAAAHAIVTLASSPPVGDSASRCGTPALAGQPGRNQ